MGGSDDLINMVNLTPREHFIVHRLLTKIYPTNYKLLYAVRRMSDYARYTNGRQYEAIRKTYSEYNKLSMIEAVIEELKKSDAVLFDVVKTPDLKRSGETTPIASFNTEMKSAKTPAEVQTVLAKYGMGSTI